jgi:hypothetical protein
VKVVIVKEMVKSTKSKEQGSRHKMQERNRVAVD